MPHLRTADQEESHGYLMIPANREYELKERFGIRTKTDLTQSTTSREPFRAIVKDLVTEDVSLTAKAAKKILREIRKFEVYNMNILARSYKCGPIR